MAKKKKERKIHPEIIKLQELRRLEEDDKLTEEQGYEMDRLQTSRRQARVTLAPSLKCCKEIQDYPAVFFKIDYRNKEGKNSLEAAGGWHIEIPQVYDRDFYRTREWFANLPSPKFCPFCGTPLPKMRRKDPVPEFIATYDYDADYCNTCGERCMCCQCDPPEAAWEEDK